VSNALASPLDSGYNSSVTHIVGLPLFPLHTVLFPGQLLPLHIFEPRYRLMVTECLAGQSTFGVVLIQEGAEVGDEATPFDVGTTARIEQVNRLDDGRFNILCVGQARFRVLSLRHNRPYLSGDVDLWPWEPPAQEQPDPRTAHVKSLLTTYLQRLAHATGNTVQLDEGRVQLQLDRVTEGAVTVRVGADVEGQAAAIQGFVNEFNDQRRFLNQNAAFFNTDAANALDTVVGANRADLQRIGITQAADGTLRVDEDRLRAALAENPGQVREVFNGFDGLARGVERFAERVTTTSPRGFTAGSAVERLLAGGTPNFNAAGALAGTQFGAALALGLLFDQYF